MTEGNFSTPGDPRNESSEEFYARQIALQRASDPDEIKRKVGEYEALSEQAGITGVNTSIDKIMSDSVQSALEETGRNADSIRAARRRARLEGIEMTPEEDVLSKTPGKRENFLDYDLPETETK